MFAAHRCPTQVELATLADPSLGLRLSQRGYELVGFENVLGLSLAGRGMTDDVPGVVVESVRTADHDAWLDLDVEASLVADAEGIAAHEEFDVDELVVAQRALASTTGFVAFLAHLDGEPAGAAGLRVVDGVAQFCGASTLPAFRRRGVQSALLAARLAAAADAGCDLAVVTVQPGSRSQANVQRQGFELLYARAVLVDERTAH
jgi:GNAT superfamily N-acetyltransferase